MNLNFLPTSSKADVFFEIRQNLLIAGFNIINEESRPWGGFFVIDEKQTTAFVNHYFADNNISENVGNQRISPKVLIVEANRRLSWQYHHRRAEIWKVIHGPIGIVRSETDRENDTEIFEHGEIIFLNQGERHRLIGLKNWGVVAEIWKHTNVQEPSNEDDIIRVSDDFGR